MELVTQLKKNRIFLPNDLQITDWEALQPYADQLFQEEITNEADFLTFLSKVNEVSSVLSEDYAWRYIHLTSDTRNQQYSSDFQYFIQNILPNWETHTDAINRKIAASPFLSTLSSDYYKTYIRSLKTEIELFREENIALYSEEQTLSQKYSAVVGSMTIEHEGTTYTMQQAAKFLESHDRDLRETIWRKIQARRAENWETCQEILDDLLVVRNKSAENCDEASYITYKFRRRFDYTPEDCYAFHDTVEKVITPIYQELMAEKKRLLGVEKLYPWDTQVDVFGGTPLRPFKTGDELIAKTIQLLQNIRPEFGEMIAKMRDLAFLDVESREGKDAGGYNYPLAESGIPFIFMNAAGAQSDVITMLHESGHAIHSFVTHDISLNALKHPPAEVAEVASMAMELLALDQYSVFYPDEKECIRAQKDQLWRSLTLFPWVVAIDAFQHWIYSNPNHTHAQRNEKWKELYLRFHGESLDWSGLEENLENSWTRQGHIYSVPFYYIEYAFAQLAAIGIFRNYKQNPEKALAEYLAALRLGYTRTIPELYEAAGTTFNFSTEYVQEILSFCLNEYKRLAAIS
jgi:oligoendopeptidase F